MRTYVDLSHTIHDGMVTYPGLPVPVLGTVLSREESRGRYEDGVEFHIGSISMCTNTGTYLDTPSHRYADGWDVSALPLDRCVDLPIVVIDHPRGPHGAIDDEVAYGFDVAAIDSVGEIELAGAAVLLRTGWSRHWGSDRYLESTHPFLTGPATSALVAAGVALVGIDSLNIDSTAGDARPAHSVLLAAGVPIIEHLTRLDEIPIRGARLTAVPLKVAGLGSFPVRAFATIEH